MTDMPKGQALLGQRALVLGIANEHSIAYGCAKVFRTLGAELAITYLNEKAKPYVEPLARDLGAALVAPCDVGKEGELEAVFDRIAETWGGLDIALHSIAFALKEDLQGPLIDSSSEGFKIAMDISCHFHPHGPPCGAADAGGRNVTGHDLPWGEQGRTELQSDGSGESRPRERRPISGL